MQPSSDLRKDQYYNEYWLQRDLSRVTSRSQWRASRLFEWIGHHFRSLLDVGAGTGELLQYFIARDYRVEGWDVAPQAVKHLQKNGFRARVVDIEKDDVDGYYDVICCCEILQHLHDPCTALQKLKPLLRPGGRFFITVPNETHLIRRLGLVKQEESHVTIFSPRRARDLVATCGLKVERCSYQPLVPPRWGGLLHSLGVALARLSPALFSLSTLMLVKREHDD